MVSSSTTMCSNNIFIKNHILSSVIYCEACAEFLVPVLYIQKTFDNESN